MWSDPKAPSYIGDFCMCKKKRKIIFLWAPRACTQLAHSLFLLLHARLQAIADSFALPSVSFGLSVWNGGWLQHFDTAQQCSDHMEVKRTDTTRGKGDEEDSPDYGRNFEWLQNTHNRAKGGQLCTRTSIYIPSSYNRIT